MRPLRLILDGFGSYRLPTEADFSDVDFFALVGPTGSGKSTLIDGLCFALYGTVPRWGKENAIAQALAPAASACRVCLVFEAAGKRYAAVRALTRDKKNVVHTREARLDRLDPAVPPDAPIADLLAASLEQLAEGPDQVKAVVGEVLGLSYEHFTQSVLLPQGRFSEFLHAKPSERQDLLVQLLAFGVYDKVGQRARERARLAAERVRVASRDRADLAGATADAEEAAAGRVAALTELASTIDASLAALAAAVDQARQAADQAEAARRESSLIAALRTPTHVRDLAGQIAGAEQAVTERRRLAGLAEQAEAAAEQAASELPDLAATRAIAAAYAERDELAARCDADEREVTARHAAEQTCAQYLEVAEQQLTDRRAALADAERGQAASAIAGTLRAGQDCPVCGQRVSSLPHRTPPADLAAASMAAEAAASAHKQAAAAHAKAMAAAAAAGGTAQGTRQQLAKITATLAGAPALADAERWLQAIAAAGDALRQARKDAADRRADLAAADRARTALRGAEERAWAELRRARDTVVPFGAPAVDDGELAAAWAALTGWATARQAERGQRQRELDSAAADLRDRAAAAAVAITGMLAGHQITVTDTARAAAAVAAYLAKAESALADVRRDRERAAGLDQRIAAGREEEQVAASLGQLLRATSFERWLCGEALDSLVREASATLMELSAGQYQLDRDDRNELVVIDFADAGARRPVNTLSGGETFQASLALALALSRQVVGLSAGMRDLNSMFLDEGFGTLDENTLETVAATLERLAGDSDAMVGVITHVQALAERVPVRFIVAKAGTTSVLRKERT
jgi:exonuclease SbcC